jgi:hypothetical protein
MIYAGGSISKQDTVVRDGPHGTTFIDSEASSASFEHSSVDLKAEEL